MSESDDPIYRIICCKDPDYSVTSRGNQLVFALTNPLDRYQHWTKDERHGATKMDSEGHSAFSLINRATGKALGHRPSNIPVPLVQYDVNSYNESVLWTMSKDVVNGFRNIRLPDHINILLTSQNCEVYDGHLIGLFPPNDPENIAFLWKIVKVLPSTCISLFRPSQHTVKINCHAKVSHNLAIDKDGTVMLVPSNPKDKYQHWVKETAYGLSVKDEEGKEAFALVNKATGKAIKHGFGHNYLVQVAPFNRNYMDPSLLWTEGNYVLDDFRQIRMQNNIHLAFKLVDPIILDSPLLGLSKTGTDPSQQWKIENFE